MSEKTLGASVRFTTENFVAVNSETVEKVIFLSSDAQKSDAHAGEHRGIFGDERGQLRMRRFELFNGLF